MSVRRPAVALAALLATAAAPGPVLRPLHDVDVTYSLGTRDGRVLHERLRWDVAAQRLRVDPPTAGLYVIIDLRARRMSTVRAVDRSVLVTPASANAAGMPTTAPGAVRQGEDTVAGLACTDWDMTDAAGEATQVCLTPDGVLLRARAGGRELLRAETVRYGTQDPAVFEVPAGYARRTVGGAP